MNSQTTKYTYEHKYEAHYGETTVMVPDQVAEDQKAYDGKSFPAIRMGLWKRGEKVRVRLDGESYGLHTSGTGDMCVKSA